MVIDKDEEGFVSQAESTVSRASTTTSRKSAKKDKKPLTKKEIKAIFLAGRKERREKRKEKRREEGYSDSGSSSDTPDDKSDEEDYWKDRPLYPVGTEVLFILYDLWRKRVTLVAQTLCAYLLRIYSVMGM